MKITEWIPVLNVCDWIIYNKLKLNADERFYCLVLLFEQNNNEKNDTTLLHKIILS